MLGALDQLEKAMPLVTQETVKNICEQQIKRQDEFERVVFYEFD